MWRCECAAPSLATGLVSTKNSASLGRSALRPPAAATAAAAACASSISVVSMLWRHAFFPFLLPGVPRGIAVYVWLFLSVLCRHLSVIFTKGN